MDSTHPPSSTSAIEENSATKTSEEAREIEQTARAVMKWSLLFAYGASLLLWIAQWAGACSHAIEFMVGAALMSTTLFFYADLVRVLLAREPRVGAVMLIAALKVFLVVLAIWAGMVSDADSLKWLIGGFLLMVPASIWIAVPHKLAPAAAISRQNFAKLL